MLYDSTVHKSGLAYRSPLCGGCLEVAARDITALKLDYWDLEQLLPPGSSPVTAWVSGTDTPAVPMDLAVDALQRDIVWKLGVWEPVVREVAYLAPEQVHGVRPGWAVVTAVDVIAPRVAALARVPLTWGYADGPEAGLVERDGVYALASLRKLHRCARAALGLTRRVVRLPGDCTRCGRATLEREDGSDNVTCGHCGYRWAGDEYRRYVSLKLAATPPPAR